MGTYLVYQSSTCRLSQVVLSVITLCSSFSRHELGSLLEQAHRRLSHVTATRSVSIGLRILSADALRFTSTSSYIIYAPTIHSPLQHLLVQGGHHQTLSSLSHSVSSALCFWNHRTPNSNQCNPHPPHLYIH